jgi:hypothetical protein
MPFVTVPKDLTKVKTKVALNLTKRQIICFGSAVVVGGPLFFLTRNAIGNQAAVLLMMAVMLPFFFTAMYEKDGQPAEKIALNFLRAKIWPARRLYKTQNLYDYIEKEGNAFEQQCQDSKYTKAKAGRGQRK